MSLTSSLCLLLLGARQGGKGAGVTGCNPERQGGKGTLQDAIPYPGCRLVLGTSLEIRLLGPPRSPRQGPPSHPISSHPILSHPSLPFPPAALSSLAALRWLRAAAGMIHSSPPWP